MSYSYTAKLADNIEKMTSTVSANPQAMYLHPTDWRLIALALRKLPDPQHPGPNVTPWTHPMTVTDAMLAAAKKAESKVGRDAILRIYRAMIGAAPSATNEPQK